MTAKEYYNSTRMVETRNWTVDMVLKFAEEYHQAMVEKASQPQLKLFEYRNKKDSNLGSTITVISDSLESAKTLIRAELSDMDLVFDETASNNMEAVVSLIESPIENNIVIESFSGDCYF